MTSLLFKASAIALCPLTLAGCLETEKSCYERLMEDFQRSHEFANDWAAFGVNDGSATPADAARYSRVASESRLEITLIYYDDERDACDYVSHGNQLLYRP